MHFRAFVCPLLLCFSPLMHDKGTMLWVKAIQAVALAKAEHWGKTTNVKCWRGSRAQGVCKGCSSTSKALGELVWGRQHKAGQRRGSPRPLGHGDVWQEAYARSCPEPTLCTQCVECKGECSPLPAGRTDPALSSVSDLPSPGQLSPEGGFLTASCQQLLAITSQCPSVQLLKAADGDVGCSSARLVALQSLLQDKLGLCE